MKVTIAVDGFLDPAHTPAMPHDLDFVSYDDPDGLRRSLADATALVSRRVNVTTELLRHAPELKLVQQIGLGTDRIDLRGAREFGVDVANTPGAVSPAVIEHAFLLVLAALRDLPTQIANMREGGWSGGEVWEGDEIAGSTFGVIGYGSIGQGIVARAIAFGANVLVTTRTPPAETLASATFVSLARLLRASDIVVLAAALTPETRGMIGRAEIALMKPTTVFVNIARGAIVDEPVLIEALQCGSIRGAGIDAFAVEPPAVDSPLRGMKNVVATPHAAGSSKQSRRRIWTLVESNLERLAQGNEVVNVVNRGAG